MEILIVKLHEDGKVSVRATEPSGGFDLYSCVDDSVPVQEQKLIRTGIAMAIPCGFVGIIRPRSGLALKKEIDVRAGIIDSDYRQEVFILLRNEGIEDFHIQKGDRIAQMLVLPVPAVTFKQVDSLEQTDRIGGLGSTGV
jgi:dUTP pyrophosphatase